MIPFTLKVSSTWFNVKVTLGPLLTCWRGPHFPNTSCLNVHMFLIQFLYVDCSLSYHDYIHLTLNSFSILTVDTSSIIFTKKSLACNDYQFLNKNNFTSNMLKFLHVQPKSVTPVLPPNCPGAIPVLFILSLSSYSIFLTKPLVSDSNPGPNMAIFRAFLGRRYLSMEARLLNTVFSWCISCLISGEHWR